VKRRYRASLFSFTIAALALLLTSRQASAAPPSSAHRQSEELVLAVVRMPSHGASATVIHTEQGKSLLLSCGHAFVGADRTKPIVLDVPVPQAGPKKRTTIRLLAVDYEADLALVELGDGPLSYTAPVVRRDCRLDSRSSLLSVGYDEMRWPATQKTATAIGTMGDTTFTVEKPWHGRSGGALFDTQNGVLVGVVSGYETIGQQRGLYVSHQAIRSFLSKRGWSVYGTATEPIRFPSAPRPGIGSLPRETQPDYRFLLSTPAPFCPGGT
jgi:hypothetical protein